MSNMNHGWNTRIEDLLILWVKQMNLNRMEHEKKARCNRNLHIAFGIPNILLNTIAGFLLMGSLRISDDSTYAKVFIIVITVIVMSSAILSAMQIFFNFGQKSEKHKQASLLYRSISSRIDATLLLYRKDRPDVKQFLQMVQTEFNNISNYSPMVFSNSIENDLPNYTLAMQILDKNYCTFHEYRNSDNKLDSKLDNKHNDSSESLLSTTNSLNNSLESMDSMESIDPLCIIEGSPHMIDNSIIDDDIEIHIPDTVNNSADNYLNIIDEINNENDYISIGIVSDESSDESTEYSDGTDDTDSSDSSDNSDINTDLHEYSKNNLTSGYRRRDSVPLLRKNSINDDLIMAAKSIDGNKNNMQKLVLKKYIDINSV